jgi:protein PsiE
MKKTVTDLTLRAMLSFEYVGLVVIAIATVIAAAADVSVMVQRGSVMLGDLLMLFLYLEVLSMVRHYLTTGTLPVRYPLYIGIVALTRFLVLDIKELTSMQVLALAAATLLLALSVLVVRYGHVRFPYPSGDGSPSSSKRDTHG